MCGAYLNPLTHLFAFSLFGYRAPCSSIRLTSRLVVLGTIHKLEETVTCRRSLICWCHIYRMVSASATNFIVVDFSKKKYRGSQAW